MTAPPHAARARASAAPVCASRVECWPWHRCRQVKVSWQTRRSCRRRPLDYSDPTRHGFEAQLEPDSDGTERAVLTGGDALSSSEQRRAQAGGGWGVTEAVGSYETCTRGRKAGEVTRHRPHGGKRRRSSLPESRKGQWWCAAKWLRGGPFYRGEHQD
jgi:hypothetical protein